MSQPPPQRGREEEPEQPSARQTPRPGGSRPRGPAGNPPPPAGATSPPAQRPAGARPAGSSPGAARQAGTRPAAASPAPARQAGTRPAARQAAPPPRPPAPRRNDNRDLVPLVIGGVVGALLLGLLAVFALGGNNSAQPAANTNPNPNANTNPNNNTLAQGQATNTPFVIEVGAQPTQDPNTPQPPRMPLEEFKALYDDPNRRPVVVDVRSQEAFDQGHILGSVNVPYDQVAANLAKLPKDRLIVAYCQ